jgi:diadenosine tetraphosphate (Ap4A) HIT family hydrolase
MMRRISLGLLLLLGAGTYWVWANPPLPAMACPCDHAEPGSMEARVCSLCRTAEEQTEAVYFLKDISPSKPNRYLALPRVHGRGMQTVGELPPEEREAVWTAAIAAPRSFSALAGDLAHNGHFFRTQCHAHIHMGPLSPEVKDEGGTLLRPSQ